MTQGPITYRLSEAPPSLNNAFPSRADGKGRYVSDRYRSWRDLAMIELMRQGGGLVSGSFEVAIRVGRGSSRADVDNLIKPIVDTLVKAELVPDDARMESVSIERADIEGVEITVSSIMAGAA